MNETVLEMHYHRALLDAFSQIYGLGARGHFNFYKYSTQRECFIGFDQAYIKSELSQEDMFELLKNAAKNNGCQLPDLFLGYFLQFKVVKKMAKRSKITPPVIQNRPHFRVELDTIKNANTGFSQHEILYLLNKNTGAMTYYACPMIFDQSSLYDIDVDLNELQLADLSTCPSEYIDNGNHYIYFNTTTSDPVWCSDPVDGKSIIGGEFAKIISKEIDSSSPQELADQLLITLTDPKLCTEDNYPSLFRGHSAPNILNIAGDMLTILRISKHA